MNDRRGYVKVKLGDGTKMLRYTTNALVELEKELGGAVQSVLQDPTKAGFAAIRALLWAGLKGAGSRFTVLAVGELMHPSKVGYYAEKCGEALSAAMQAEDEEASEDDHLRPTEAPQE